MAHKQCPADYALFVGTQCIGVVEVKCQRKKGWNYYALRDNWLRYARAETGKDNLPKNAEVAFVNYCKKAKSQR